MESKSEGSIKFPALLAAPLLILMAALAGGAALRESITIDEVAHLGAAVSYPQKRDLRLNEEYPPLAKILAALPLVLRGIHTDYSDISWIFSNGWFNAMLGYESAKARITRALLDLVERHHAGWEVCLRHVAFLVRSGFLRLCMRRTAPYLIQSKHTASWIVEIAYLPIYRQSFRNLVREGLPTVRPECAGNARTASGRIIHRSFISSSNMCSLKAQPVAPTEIELSDDCKDRERRA